LVWLTFRPERGRWVLASILWLHVAVLAIDFSPRDSWATPEVAEGSHEERPRAQIRPKDFAAQAKLQQAAVDAFNAVAVSAKPKMFAVMYAPYASEPVFKNEVLMVERRLKERYGEQVHTASLVNQVGTPTHAWAMAENLEQLIGAAAQRMNPERDVLLLYLTSHGGRDHALASEFYPLRAEPLRVADMQRMLDAAGVKNRVVIVSACYAGGWLAPLANDSSVVLTAADATHTSYGCGLKSELTFFGRALFDEAFAQTGDLETAFAQAVPVIKKREEEAQKKDGFSNPQIHVGPGARAALAAFAAKPATGTSTR
jgi:hypothetical protein